MWGGGIRYWIFMTHWIYPREGGEDKIRNIYDPLNLLKGRGIRYWIFMTPGFILGKGGLDTGYL